jgi:hypothetical protein
MTRYVRILGSCILSVVMATSAVAQQSKNTQHQAEPKRPLEIAHVPKSDAKGRDGSQDRSAERNDRRGDASRGQNDRAPGRER